MLDFCFLRAINHNHEHSTKIMVEIFHFTCNECRILECLSFWVELVKKKIFFPQYFNLFRHTCFHSAADYFSQHESQSHLIFLKQSHYFSYWNICYLRKENQNGFSRVKRVLKDWSALKKAFTALVLIPLSNFKWLGCNPFASFVVIFDTE